MENLDKIRYYRLKEEGENDIFVRVRNEVNLEYLNSEFEWIPNQEWFVSMFYDKDIDYEEVLENDVNLYIANKLNSYNISGTKVPNHIFKIGDKMKKGMILGLTGAMIGAGLLIYSYVLSPRTKKKLMSLENDMCEDFENMMCEK